MSQTICGAKTSIHFKSDSTIKHMSYINQESLHLNLGFAPTAAMGSSLSPDSPLKVWTPVVIRAVSLQQGEMLWSRKALQWLDCSSTHGRR